MWLSVWSEVQIVCDMVQLMPLHPKTPSSLASFKFRLVLPFWYRLTEVVLEKRPLNGCSSAGSGCTVLYIAQRISGPLLCFFQMNNVFGLSTEIETRPNPQDKDRDLGLDLQNILRFIIRLS